MIKLGRSSDTRPVKVDKAARIAHSAVRHNHASPRPSSQAVATVAAVWATIIAQLVTGGLQAARLAARMCGSRAEEQVQQRLLHSEDGQQYASSASTRGEWYCQKAEHDGSNGEDTRSR